MADWLSKEQRTRNMSAIRSSGTATERRLGELLREVFPRRKLVDYPDLPGRPDFYLPGLRLVVFADGCFWHGCRQHGRVPEDNREYWEAKLARNRRRDRAVARQLKGEGFRVVRVWHHELKERPGRAASKLVRAVGP
jgi:DNA mismatch endonuclease (patch repair protein)